MHLTLAVCVLLATATGETHGHLFRRWLALGQLPASGQHSAAANRDDTAWSRAADGAGNSVTYFGIIQELFVFDEEPEPITTPEKTLDTGVPSDPSTRVPATTTRSQSTSTRAPTTSTIAPTTSTRAPTTSTRAPTTNTRASTPSTRAPTTNTRASTPSTRAPTTSTRAPTTSTRAPTTSTRTPTTSTRAPTTSTRTPTTSTTAPKTTSTVPPGYTYYPATGSSYKLHPNMERSWYDANDTCTSEGAYLTVLDDAEEAEIVKGIVIREVGEYYGAWLGLRDSREGGVTDWRTVQGVPLNDVFHEWYKGRPYDAWEPTCGVFSPSEKQLFDRPCSDYLKWHFVCERSQ